MIPETYKVDFSAKRKDLVQQSLDRLLHQFKNAPVINQIVAAYAKQYQELHSAVIDSMEQRTLYNAKGVYADTLGSILGRKRQIYFEGGTNQNADDEFYSHLLLFQTWKNRNKFSSVPELMQYFEQLFDFDVSFQRIDVMKVMLLVPPGSSDALDYQIKPLAESAHYQHALLSPFPATIELVYTEIEVLGDINGSGKSCLVKTALVGVNDDDEDIWNIYLETTSLKSSKSYAFYDIGGSGIKCKMQGRYDGKDDNDEDVWSVVLSTTNSGNAVTRKFIDANGSGKRCKVSTALVFQSEVEAPDWSLVLTTV